MAEAGDISTFYTLEKLLAFFASVYPVTFVTLLSNDSPRGHSRDCSGSRKREKGNGGRLKKNDILTSFSFVAECRIQFHGNRTWKEEGAGPRQNRTSRERAMVECHALSNEPIDVSRSTRRRRIDIVAPSIRRKSNCRGLTLGI